MASVSTPRPVTLSELLDSRDNRRLRQQQWLGLNPGFTLMVLTVVMPGSVKRDARSLAVAHAAVQELRREFDGVLRRLQTFDLNTGFEAFLLLSESPAEAKIRACNIEDSHPLGRLFDIDVFTAEGLPISRDRLGLPARRCLICDSDARVCMRAGSHSYDDLLAHIASMVDSYSYHLSR